MISLTNFCSDDSKGSYFVLLYNRGSDPFLLFEVVGWSSSSFALGAFKCLGSKRNVGGETYSL